MILPLLLFLVSFLYYVVTLNGTIPAYRDSGDLISAIYTLGIAHPPGYPLYILLGKLFTQAIPLANVAYRVNLFSAFCAAVSVAVLYVLAKSNDRENEPAELFPVAGAACVAALLYGATPAVQTLARVSEMYTLAVLFAAVILLCYRRNTPPYQVLGCFLLGLGFGVQPTLIFLIPLFISLKPQEAGRRVVFFLAGFSVVIVLWVRSKVGPVQNWGDPSTLQNLWRLITRSNYGGLKLHPEQSQFSWTWEGAFSQGVYFFQTLRHQWGWLGLAAGLIGLGLSFKQDLRLAAVWLLAGPCFVLLSNLPLAENTTTPILEPYFLLVNLIWALWVARSFSWGLRRVPSLTGQASLAIVLLALPLAEGSGSFQSYRHHFYAYDLGRNMLRTLPSGAVLYDPDDPIAFTLRTFQLTEHRREDVVLLNFFLTYWGYRQITQRWPDLLPSVPIHNAQELEQLFWTYSIQRRPFYADLPVKVPLPLSYRVEGLLYPIQSTAQPPDLSKLEHAETLFTFYTWRGDWRTSRHPDFFTQHIFNYRAAARCNLGLKYAERKDWSAARRHYWEALAIDPHLSAAYNDLGVVDYNQHHYQQAIQNYQWALRYDPTNEGYQHNLKLVMNTQFRSKN